MSDENWSGGKIFADETVEPYLTRTEIPAHVHRTGGAQSKTPGITGKPGKLIGKGSILQATLRRTETTYLVDNSGWIEKGVMMTVIYLNGMSSHSDAVTAELAEKSFFRLLLASLNGIGIYR
ncbi:MAG: hypothetical protein QNJ17_00745 [Desulfocapsaceae bacterium]|nr:hypothetical protein [Desulfocapsaceae bacterium]